MFIHNKRNIVLPLDFKFGVFAIEVVSEFKLLGVLIDNKMNFSGHVRLMRVAINKKLYSIEKLFFLPKSVKLQFFKTFIMPHFDYCFSLAIYFSKHAIQSLANCFYICLYILFNLKFKVSYSDDFNTVNNELESLGLNEFIHRLIIKLSTFVHKLLNDKSAPTKFKKLIIPNNTLNKNHKLRNQNQFCVPGSHKNNSYGDESFAIFFSKFINELFLKDLDTDFILFKIRVVNNVNISFIKFVKLFPKFDIDFRYISNFINYRKNI
jgi:hypothetical protein